MMKEEFRSRVYTDRPDYADFDAPAKFNAIQSIIAKRLREHPNAIVKFELEDGELCHPTWEHCSKGVIDGMLAKC